MVAIIKYVIIFQSFLATITEIEVSFNGKIG
jgi:hypothetical protein